MGSRACGGCFQASTKTASLRSVTTGGAVLVGPGTGRLNDRVSSFTCNSQHGGLLCYRACEQLSTSMLCKAAVGTSWPTANMNNTQCPFERESTPVQRTSMTCFSTDGRVSCASASAGVTPLSTVSSPPALTAPTQPPGLAQRPIRGCCCCHSSQYLANRVCQQRAGVNAGLRAWISCTAAVMHACRNTIDEQQQQKH
jgi:hypothetical protein